MSVEHYISRMLNTLSRVTGQAIEVLDFDDDRLSHLLRHLSTRKTWNAVERDLNLFNITEIIRMMSNV